MTSIVSGSKAYAFQHYRDPMSPTPVHFCLYMEIFQHPEELVRLTFLLFLICVCTSLCACVHTHAHIMWKPQVNVKCLSQLSYALFFQTGSLTDPGAHRLGSAGWSGIQGSAYFCLPAPRSQTCTTTLSFKGWGSELRSSSLLIWQVLY